METFKHFLLWFIDFKTDQKAFELNFRMFIFNLKVNFLKV